MAVIAVAMALALAFRPEKPSELVKGWSTAPVEGGEDAVIADAASAPFGVVAVGRRDRDRGQDAVVWLTVDGHAWRPVEVEIEPPGAVPDRRLTAVAASNDLLVAGGVEDGLSGMWVSADEGSTWERVPHDEVVFLPGEITGIAHLEQKGWVAVGHGRHRGERIPVVLNSPDGYLWERVEPPQIGNVGEEGVTDVTPGGTGALAGGYSEDPSGDTTVVHTPFWSSEDARSWKQLPDSEGVFPPATIVRAMTQAEKATVGLAEVEEEGRTSVVAFRSLDDGNTWAASRPLPTAHATSPRAAAGAASARVAGVTTSPDGFLVAVGTLEEGDHVRLAVWISADAADWELLADPHLEAATGVEASAVGAAQRQTVVLGHEEAGAVAWVHGPPGSPGSG
ncbi:MAG TPA: hypothetical protein VHF25_02105 [Nitriliruptorales bacterium]|nr:hypothetical protein [Nitriliruptorales bacterium]